MNSLARVLFELLCRGDAKAFNKAREQSGGAPVVIDDLLLEGPEELKFEGKDFSKLNLRGLTIKGAALSKIVFGDASLRDFTLEDCAVSKCTFSSKDTGNLAFKLTDFWACTFEDMDWKDINVEGSSFSGAEKGKKNKLLLKNCKLKGFPAWRGSWRQGIHVVPASEKAFLFESLLSGITSPRQKKPATPAKKKASPKKTATT